MSFLVPCSDLRSYFVPTRFPDPTRFSVSARLSSTKAAALNLDNNKTKTNDPRRSICTADELHYVPISDWNLALRRYLPSPQAEPRNHPLLLLSGLATNAIGYDLSPESSFACYMAAQGYDTWIIEVRGVGLSTRGLLQWEDSSSVKRVENGPFNIVEVGQQAVTSFVDFQERFSTRFGDFQKQLDLIGKLDWDFDHYLEEDVPIAGR